MNKLQRLANLYYYRTYKAGAKSLIDPPWVIPLLGCLVAFAWNFFAFVATDHKDGNYYSNPYLWASVFFEIAFLWCLSGYQEDHDSLCVEKFRRKR
ncbi:MAG TPA: hypothetical protein VN201_09710, partial [Roseateles sp.]|nr:hypothetical protein [Roseateles sp.]